MRIVRYATPSGPAWGVCDGDVVRSATGRPFVDLEPGAPVGALADVDLLAPVTPSTVMCVGRNYAAHAEELGNEVPVAPLLFLKPPAAIVGPDAPIVLPSVAERVDHEAELVVVIGRTASQVDEAAAMDVVGGYTCGNDVTARDLQKSDPGGQWTRGKGFDTFAPMGPWIETELDPSALRVTCTVDDERRQDGRTDQFIFTIPTLIAHISSFTRLQPGDVIMTGTPAGVGPLTAGQQVTVTVEGIGALRNPVVAATS
jgi:2-keto-4-pentenoate hydratase/2-oxohepta-3-ene-1,7-dioic acid hydratase in catechol pathway